MKMKFTPGPWTLEYEKWHKEIELPEPAAWVDFDDVDQDEALANAHLISAAPDLFHAGSDALAELREDVKNFGPCEHDIGHCICGLIAVADRLEAALKKARGES